MTRLRTLATATLVLAIAPPARATEAPQIELLSSGKVTQTALPFSEVVRVGKTLHLSGQIGIKPGPQRLRR